MLDVRKMELLRELARLGTIAAVAQAQFCTPSAVSQQLSALEREAGVKLLRRSGRGVELTAAGADLADRTGAMLALLEEAEAALAAHRTELTGELRIGAFPTAVRTLLPGALVRLGAEYPRLELRVTELDPAEVPDALRTGALDIALVHEYDYVPAEPDPAIMTQPLLAETIFLAYSAADGRGGERYATDAVSAIETVSAIENGTDPVLASSTLPWIAATPGTLCHLMAVRLCQAAGFTPRIRHYADDFAAVLTLVAAGQGVALVPELALADLPDGVTLAALPALRRTLIACRRGAAAHPAVVAAAAAIRAAAADYLDVTAPHRPASPASERRRAQPPSNRL
ncbi:MAG TPA: LysR family transcriptional regulator [Streptosporangiaceae bacterium]|nr:LysR family transcriptional regulator [Streptosporangiaceae bacterium]